jgi:tryptophan-rich sensory protein
MNSRRDLETDRHAGPGAQVAMGLALAGGAILASMLVAHAHREDQTFDQYDGEYAELVTPSFKPKRAIFNLIWPPMMMAMTLSGLRVWNSPPSEARTRALTLWSLVQGFNTVWMAAGTKRMGGQVTASVAALAAGGAYALSARKIEAPASSLAGPYLGWMGLANLITDQISRRPAR